MATIALAAAGSNLIGTATVFGIENFAIGQMIGATVGSIIDSYLLMPALFPQEDYTAPGIDTAQFGGASEGSPVWRTSGGPTRVPGTWTYLSDLIKTSYTVGGGKGGGGSETTLFNYSLHGMATFRHGQTSTFKAVFMDGKKVYTDPTDVVEVTSDQFEMKVTTTTHEPYVTRVYIRSTDLGPKLINYFYSGLDIVISGFTNPNNNGTFKAKSSTYYSDTGESEIELQNVGQGNEAIGDTVTITQQSQGWLPFIADNVYMYTGSQTTADSFLEGIHGVGKVPAFEGYTYIVFDRMKLEQFGNRAPVIEAIIEDGSVLGPYVSEVIDDIMGWAGFTDYSVDSSLQFTDAFGFKFQGYMAPAKMLTPLMMIHNVAVRETDGTLVFYKREDADEVTVASENYPVSVEGDRAKDRPFLTTELDIKDLPKEVKIQFSNSDNDLQSASRTYLMDDAEASDSLTVDLSMATLDPDTARQVGMKMLHSAWVNAKKVDSFTLTGQFFYLQEGDILNINYAGEDRKLFIQTIDQSPNGIITIRGFFEETQMFGITYLGGTGQTASTKPPTPGVTEGYLYNCRPLRYGDSAFDAGNEWYLYQAVGPQGDNYYGSTTWEDDGGGYELVAQNPNPQTLGYATTALADCVDPLVWDYKSTVRVRLYNGSLSSSTKEKVAALERNIAVLGNPPRHEVIGFVNATLVGPDTYELSTLLRGLRGTESSTPYRSINDSFALVDGMTKVPVGSIGGDRFYKVLSTGDELGDVSVAAVMTAVQGFHSGPLTSGYRAAMPVTNTYGSRDSSNNIRVFGDIRGKDLNRTFFEEVTNPSEFVIIQLVPGLLGNPLSSTFKVYEVITSAELFRTVGVEFAAATLSLVGLTPSDPQYVLVSAFDGAQEQGTGGIWGTTHVPSLSTFTSITIA